VTRRAVEAATLAAAIKFDPDNYERWLDPEARLARWEERHQGRRPKKQPGQGIKYPPVVEQLRAHLGTLSDMGTHLTPEFILTQRYRVEPIQGTKGGFLQFSYFEREQRELERMLMFVATVHLQILEVFNELFGGVFHHDEEWVRSRDEITRYARPLAERFRAEANDEPRGL
jgi:hypothetical protein